MQTRKWVIWVIAMLVVTSNATAQRSRVSGVWTGTWYVDEKRTSSGSLSGSSPYPSQTFSLYLLSHDPATNRFGYVSFSSSYPGGDIIELSVEDTVVSMTIDYSPYCSIPADPAYYAHITGNILEDTMQGDFDESNPAASGWISFLGAFALSRTAGGEEVTLTGLHTVRGAHVLQWEGNRTNLLYMVEACTNLHEASWSPVMPTSQWWTAQSAWTNTGSIRSCEFFRVKAKKQ